MPRSARQLRVAVALALPCLMALGAAGTEAAVRSCQPPRASGVVTGATENEGKRRAIEAWMAKVQPLGARYTSWSTATQRILKCINGKSGGFDCVAVATPCTIEQNPGAPKAPQPGRPVPRKRPGDPGRPIDV